MIAKTLVSALALASGVLAQTPQLNQTYIAGLVATLEGAGLTNLTSIVPGAANTTLGMEVFSILPNDTRTVFAPSNDAFTGFKVPTDQNTLADIITYHIASGNFSNSSSFDTFPNTTIIRTFLNDSSVVHLEGNKSQVLVGTALPGNKTALINAGQNVTVSKTLKFENLVIHVIDSVLTIPDTPSNTFKSSGLTALSAALGQANLTGPVENAHGLTIFAPTDKAFTTALANVGSQSTNVTFLQAVLGNHIINGTSVYSSSFGGGSFTSASGESFTLTKNSTGEFVTSGNSTAKVTQSDILLSNGVLHIIDSVLVNADTNPSAASSAFNSATSAAGTSPTATQTGPVKSGAEVSTSISRALGALCAVAVVMAL